MHANHDSLTSEIALVLVGEKKFRIHKTHLRSSSDFFKNATKAEWTDPDDPAKPIDLSDESPDTFEAYGHWLYSRKILAKEELGATWNHLAHLYVLGEKLMDKTFQDAVIDTMIGFNGSKRTTPASDAIIIIYKGTPGGSPARRLMVDFYAYMATSNWSGLHLKNISEFRGTEFLEELVPMLIEQREVPPLRVMRPWRALPESYRFDGGR
ncbi:hypothetical protein P153DRAFT_290245 [Dothidotthia symphoricarpi CBS 119687]|uniref:BTB domain-containing protein n=1 Tax=Dothidotthia symphoricarpi CBS 119687 TaxID=1392245 RepID=A0A6A6AE24_9PLEO|nr:uncharacterized protein P153DRAFT_290245 [Dothidotthia symphoricarpi CBS 119687]KAF2130162.1 hypothetical protein P153DRAFT_290245 [Dothidotthia symphoricarpi CBS 119687]